MLLPCSSHGLRLCRELGSAWDSSSRLQVLPSSTCSQAYLSPTGVPHWLGAGAGRRNLCTTTTDAGMGEGPGLLLPQSYSALHETAVRGARQHAGSIYSQPVEGTCAGVIREQRLEGGNCAMLLPMSLAKPGSSCRYLPQPLAGVGQEWL